MARKKMCKTCTFITNFEKQKNVGWCDKRKRVVGRKTNFFTDIWKDYCNYWFVRKNQQ